MASIVSRRHFSDHNHDVESYGVISGYPCCTVNMHMGYPMLTENLWMSTNDDGLAAIILGTSVVNAKVGHGQDIDIVEETNYPFSDKIIFSIKTTKQVNFPLSIRIPSWCKNASVLINGKVISEKIMAQTFLKLNRNWKNGDKIELTLPMEIKLSRWENNSLGVERGPLVYAMAVDENWQKTWSIHETKKREEFPSFQIRFNSPWNYGIVLKENQPETSFILQKRDYPKNEQVWSPGECPIYLTVRARKLPSWQLNQYLQTDPLPMSPVASEEPLEEVKLLPIGATRLRITYMPVLDK